MDMRFGTWNIRSLYRAGLLQTVARESGKSKLDFLLVQVVRRALNWNRIIHFDMEKGVKFIS
jgi:hypothetical protein